VAVIGQTGEKVTFTTSDNVVITGTLWNAGAAQPAVLCLHQWRSDRSSFGPLAATLAKAGMTVLTIDARGYGESKTTSAGKTVRPDRDIQPDVQAAVSYLKNTVKCGKIGLLGASYGSSNAVIFGAKSPDVTALVLLSPGLNYFNQLPTEGPIQQLGGKPVLAFASSEDVRSVEAIHRYSELLGDKITYKIYTDIGHGTDMVAADKEITAKIRDFFSKSLK
jgi:pimeloyl-ACP methyl ester carboxylesterase